MSVNGNTSVDRSGLIGRAAGLATPGAAALHRLGVVDGTHRAQQIRQVARSRLWELTVAGSCPVASRGPASRPVTVSEGGA